jgi:hypothetical protein
MDLTLQIYGNANMDDAVNQKDVDYLADIISGKSSATAYADANKDGQLTKLMSSRFKPSSTVPQNTFCF